MNEICKLKINDIMSLQELAKVMVLNNYKIQMNTIYKKFPREKDIDYFEVTILEEKSNE